MQTEPYSPSRNLHVIGLGLLIFLSFLFGIGSGPLFDVDEGAFSEATREMLVSKNFLTTYLNGLPRFDKPILIYWLQLLSVSSFGLNEFALRLPSALSAALWAVATFTFVKRERNETEAFLSTALLVLSLQVSIIAKAAIADALLNCCLAVTMFAIYRYWRDRRRSSIYVAFAAMGLGVLTKGPVAILIPVATSFLFFLLERDLKAWFRAVLNPTAIGLFLVIVLPWYTLEYLDQGQAFIDGFIMKHNVGRFSGSMEGHSGSILYYVPVIIIGLMPSTTLLIQAFTRFRELLADPLSRFSLIWAGFVFVLFSFSSTKLPHYMIYGYTPLFIIMGAELARTRRPWLHTILPAATMLLLAALPPLLARATSDIPSLFVQAQLHALQEEMSAGRFMIVMAGGALLMLLLQAVPGLPRQLRFILGALVMNVSINFIIMPMAASVMQAPVKEAAMIAKRDELKIVMWKVYYPSFLVYSESLVEKRRPEPGDVVLTSIDHIGKLEQWTRVYEKNGIILARIPANKASR
ncbi:MAG: glycosyltransferase family 39 protein [Chlorobiaceae bacterium]|nr:glycosyltransferase family 39 protein [Chlorobiaceae bacterium]NTW73388.1 glycosyltransferase family 39 protein [Chlorobiaceae bacterium]